MPITKEGFPDKKIKNEKLQRVVAWRQFLRPSDVKGNFDDMRKPKPYWSECWVSKINKERKNNNNNKKQQQNTKKQQQQQTN